MKNHLKINFPRASFCKHLQFVFMFTILMGCSNSHQPIQNTTNWQFYSQREAIAPSHWIDKNVLFEGAPTLALSGNNKEYSNGSWTYTYDVIPSKYYKFVTNFKPTNLNQIDRSTFAQITWLTSSGKYAEFVEFPSAKAEPIENNWFRLQQTYQIPDSVVKAKVDLVYRWNAEGSVHFGGTSLEETNQIPERKVRLATIYHRPRNTSSPKENLEQFKEFLNIAGNKNADIVCLSEGITVIGTGKTYLEVSETIPGSTTKYLGELAKEHNMYIVAGIYENVGEVVYNTSVLIGRNGEVAGKYRKVSLPREEIDAGLTPGDALPVFDTDFGKVGMMICWDLQFPEPARMLTFKGAEVILMPIWGGDIILAKARAIENQIYLVSSSYDMESGVFDKNGKLIVEATNENPVAIVEVDLNQRNILPWVGDFKNRIHRELPRTKAISY